MKLNVNERFTILSHTPFPRLGGYKDKVLKKEIQEALSLDSKELDAIDFEEKKTEDGGTAQTFDRKKASELEKDVLDENHIEYILELLLPKAKCENTKKCEDCGNEASGLTDQEFAIFDKLGGEKKLS